MKRRVIFHSNLGHWRWIGWLRTSRCGRWQRLGQSAPEIRGLGYGALGARLGSEKRSGRGRRSHLGVGGCGEAAARPSIGKHLRWLLILDEDGAPLVKARGEEDSECTGGPSWLGGGAQVAAVWCGVDSGLARKIAAALAL
jgi:hypothetical protein